MVSLVIEEYSRAQTLDQIVHKTNLSKGSVYNITKKWKSQLGEGNVDEVRKFQNSMKKSGLTIKDCALGFRIFKMLEKFNLHDDFEKPLTDLTWGESVQTERMDVSDQEFASHFVSEDLNDKENARMQGNEILSFLADIYDPCQKYSIKPTNIIKWIQDLLNNFSKNDLPEIKISNNSDIYDSSNNQGLVEIPLITQVDTFLEGKKQQYSDLRKKISQLNGELNKVLKKYPINPTI